uniref:basic salivary proline-rich protein 2-like n=1 Tax=Jaculus jaculus TaxID=51337 RepID=UPI001E1B21E4|nr:basic salivary proline-rich protein 2-like [Jaculus jaculus]
MPAPGDGLESQPSGGCDAPPRALPWVPSSEPVLGTQKPGVRLLARQPPALASHPDPHPRDRSSIVFKAGIPESRVPGLRDPPPSDPQAHPPFPPSRAPTPRPRAGPRSPEPAAGRAPRSPPSGRASRGGSWARGRPPGAVQPAAPPRRQGRPSAPAAPRRARLRRSSRLCNVSSRGGGGGDASGGGPGSAVAASATPRSTAQPGPRPERVCGRLPGAPVRDSEPARPRPRTKDSGHRRPRAACAQGPARGGQRRRGSCTRPRPPARPEPESEPERVGPERTRPRTAASGRPRSPPARA